MTINNNMNQNDYFKNTWKSRLDDYKYSGWALINEVSIHESVIDVGCGFNEFKAKIPNLVGIDPANSAADILSTVEDFYTPDTFNVAFCLGSINFGTKATIENQITRISKLLKPKGRIYWRCNPGKHDHGNNECKGLDFYPWTFKDHIELSDKHGFRLQRLCWDNCDRIYAEWQKR